MADKSKFSVSGILMTTLGLAWTHRSSIIWLVDVFFDEIRKEDPKQAPNEQKRDSVYRRVRWKADDLGKQIPGYVYDMAFSLAFDKFSRTRPKKRIGAKNR